MTRSYLAELLGTFALVFIGAGAVTVNAISGGALGLLGIALAHGLVLMSMIYGLGHVSGGHFNPAVTVALFAAKKIEMERAAGYILAQLVGAALAGLFLITLFATPAAEAVHYGLTDIAAGFPLENALLLEGVLTFFLVLTVFGVAVSGRASPAVSGVAIGLVLAFDILIGGSFTGAAMNPARAFGPALVSGAWTTQWIYWAGPVVGGLVAAGVYLYLLSENAPAFGPRKRH